MPDALTGHDAVWALLDAVAGVNAYDKWTPRSAVGTGGRAQVFPTVVSQRTATQAKPIVYVAYADHARGDTTKPNIAYDVKYRRSLVGGGAFQGPVLVTGQSSLSQFFTIGDYFDSSSSQRLDRQPRLLSRSESQCCRASGSRNRR